MTAAAIERTTTLRVGEVTTGWDLENAPVGSIIISGDTRYDRVADGMWERVNNRQYRYSPHDFQPHQCRVESIPEGYTYAPRPEETVHQYMWRFRQHALRGAVQNGVSYDASERALRDMGAGAEHFPLGKGVRMLNPQDMRSLPTDTLVYLGSPAFYGGFMVWQKRGNSWHRVLGEGGRSPEEGRGGCTILTLGNSDATPAWVTASPSEGEAGRIAEFKATAWRRGWELKREQSWCGTYENVMRQFGLTRDAIRHAGGLRIGDRVPPETAANLPPFTLLTWQSQDHPDRSAIYVRSDASTNMARTLLVRGFGDSGSRAYRSSMVIAALPAGTEEFEDGGHRDSRVVIHDVSLMDKMPPGTEFKVTHNGNWYMTCQDGKITDLHTRGQAPPASGRWTGQDFGGQANFYIYTIGGMTL